MSLQQGQDSNPPFADEPFGSPASTNQMPFGRNVYAVANEMPFGRGGSAPISPRSPTKALEFERQKQQGFKWEDGQAARSPSPITTPRGSLGASGSGNNLMTQNIPSGSTGQKTNIGASAFGDDDIKAGEFMLYPNKSDG